METNFVESVVIIKKLVEVPLNVVKMNHHMQSSIGTLKDGKTKTLEVKTNVTLCTLLSSVSKLNYA